jgi:hypothetical protein
MMHIKGSDQMHCTYGDQNMVIRFSEGMVSKKGKHQININTRGRINPHIIAYNVHPSDQTSVLSSISAWLGQSHSSGDRKGAEQCSDAHSYISRQVASTRSENPS